MQILVVEDHADIAANIGDFLESRGHLVDFAADGVAGFEQASRGEFDVILLDIMLPGFDGLTVAHKLRQEALCDTPILMLTARDTLDDRLAGFRAGGDDYLIKPFALLELEARITALHKRATAQTASPVLQLDSLCFDTKTLVITRAGRGLQLKPMARKLLEILLRARGEVLSRAKLEVALWGDDPPEGDALAVHIHAIRHALDGPDDKPLLHTVRGAGYRLAVSH